MVKQEHPQLQERKILFSCSRLIDDKLNNLKNSPSMKSKMKGSPTKRAIIRYALMNLIVAIDKQDRELLTKSASRKV